jgi:glycosyltransferase involved in cell wall biosynthesis
MDVLTPDHDALVVPRRDARALASAMVRLIDEPATRVRLSEAARISAAQYDIATFVAKMQRLYDLLHRVSRATHRRGVLGADLSFLTTKVPA